MPARSNIPRLTDIVEAIERVPGIAGDLTNDIGIKDLASAACLSPFHVSGAFKATTGESPYRFVADRRLDTANALLAEDSWSLADIALISNFSSQASFTRGVTGLSPGQFRRRAK